MLTENTWHGKKNPDTYGEMWILYCQKDCLNINFFIYDIFKHAKSEAHNIILPIHSTCTYVRHSAGNSPFPADFGVISGFWANRVIVAYPLCGAASQTGIRAASRLKKDRIANFSERLLRCSV